MNFLLKITLVSLRLNDLAKGYHRCLGHSVYIYSLYLRLFNTFLYACLFSRSTNLHAISLRKVYVN